MIDLHIHSTCSDGTFTPKQIVQKVIAKGLYGFSLTDHDTVDGIPEILAMDLPDRAEFLHRTYDRIRLPSRSMVSEKRC